VRLSALFDSCSEGKSHFCKQRLWTEIQTALEQVKRWDLDQYLKERKFESLVYRAPA